MRLHAAATCALGTIACMLLAGPAAAKRGPTEFALEHFEPLPGQDNNILNIGTSKLLPHLGGTVGLFFHYASKQLNQADGNTASASLKESLVEGSLKAELSGALGLFDFAELGLVLPLSVHQFGSDLAPVGLPGTEVDGFAIGDLRVIPKVRLLDPEDFGGFGASIMVPVYIPTGDTETFNSDGSVRVEPRVVLDYHFDMGLSIALNFGYQFRPTTTVKNLTVGPTVRWGLGVRTPLFIDELGLAISAFGSIPIEDNVDTTGAVLESFFTSPIEAVAGLEIEITPQWQATVGGGAGLTRGIGAPTYRVFASVGYTNKVVDTDGDGIADPDDKCVTVPEDKDGFEDTDGCPEDDNDKDGILDVDDKCPNDPEDRDSWEDDDGCPDRDNDNDKFLDEADKCPNKPEDYDNFEDTDGCPDPDNDNDGFPDAEDKCPNEPEDRDGFEDEDGCPDPDNDNDKIPDVRDKCPLFPEDYNGIKDDDGCPDEGDLNPEGESLTLRNVHFPSGSATIRKKSYGVIAKVARFIQRNVVISKFMIEGHTDNRSGDDYNRKLSNRRAAAVVQALIDRGIPAAKLVSRGYGEDCPVADNSSRLGRAKNRRVDVKVLEVQGKPSRSYRPPKCDR